MSESQAVIPGTEDAVSASEQAKEYSKAGKIETATGKQLAFISGLGKDLPGQETLFDVDGLDQPSP